MSRKPRSRTPRDELQRVKQDSAKRKPLFKKIKPKTKAKKVKPFSSRKGYRNLPETGHLHPEKTVNYILENYYGVFRSAGVPHPETEERLSNTSFKFLDGYNESKILVSRKGYLNRIVYSEIRNYYREKSKLRAQYEVELDPSVSIEQKGGICWQEHPFAIKEILAILNPRQQEIVKFLLEGYTQTQIANEMDLKPSTISYHIKQLRRQTALTYFLNLPQMPNPTQEGQENEENNLTHIDIERNEDE